MSYIFLRIDDKEKEILKEASKKKGYPSLNFFIIKIIKKYYKKINKLS